MWMWTGHITSKRDSGLPLRPHQTPLYHSAREWPSMWLSLQVVKSGHLTLLYTAWPTKNKKMSLALIFGWSTFSFDYSILHQKVYFYSAFFRHYLVLMMGECDQSAKPSPSYSNDSQWCKIWTLWWSIHLVFLDQL